MTADREQTRRDEFAGDVLERLIASNQQYQREHGHYIVPLAQRLLSCRAELEQAERDNETLSESNRALQRSVIENRDGRHQAERAGRISDMALEKALARAEQAERKSQNDAACIASLRAETVQAERERDYHARAAEDAFIECEARVAKVPALVEALRQIIALPVPQAVHAIEIADVALAAYEQDTQAAHDARGNATEERTG